MSVIFLLLYKMHTLVTERDIVVAALQGRMQQVCMSVSCTFLKYRDHYIQHNSCSAYAALQLLEMYILHSRESLHMYMYDCTVSVWFSGL